MNLYTSSYFANAISQNDSTVYSPIYTFLYERVYSVYYSAQSEDSDDAQTTHKDG